MPEGELRRRRYRAAVTPIRIASTVAMTPLPVVADEEKYQRIRQHLLDLWRTETERSDRARAYRMFTVDDDVSDVTLAFAWLYGDSMRGDTKKSRRTASSTDSTQLWASSLAWPSWRRRR